MEYIYEQDGRSYEDLASGRVLYNGRGMTGFPVRLASEIAGRCFHMLAERGNAGPYTLYDPCCGGGYLLASIGLLHSGKISRVLAADIDAAVLELAAKNLALLSRSGMEQRMAQLQELIALYGKPAHYGALESAQRLLGMISQSVLEHTAVYQQDSTASSVEEAGGGVDLVMTDLPYGNLVSWGGGSASPAADLLASLYKRLKPRQSVVAIIADKGQKLAHEQYRRVKQLKVGKRQIAIFEPMG